MITEIPQSSMQASGYPASGESSGYTQLYAVPAKEEEPYHEAECAAVKMWLRRISDAREKAAEDFKRMRCDMDFAAGLQWAGQLELADDRYVANLVLRYLNEKVAHLYARNPKATAKRRERLDFQLWDENLDSIANALLSLQANPTDPVALALLTDYRNGTQLHKMVDKIGKSLELANQWMWDNAEPSFALQMKQLVRRVVTTGVGFVRLNFKRANDSAQPSDDGSSLGERLKQLASLTNEVMEGEISKEDARIETLKALANSLGVELQTTQSEVQEYLVYDFLPATSLIIDSRCRCIKGFVGARWIAQRYLLPLSEVNAFFETKIEAGGELVTYDDSNACEEPRAVTTDRKEPEKPLVALYEVFDKGTKTRFFLCEGWKYYVQAPEVVYPKMKRFWPIFALAFNDVEVEPGCKATIYPPSDVHLMRSSQKEWNRTQEAKRDHRKANAPKYMTGKGWLTENDKDAIVTAVPNAVIEIEGAPVGSDVNLLLKPFQHSPIDPALYDTSGLAQDIFMTVGTQEGPVPASSKATATAAAINEQQRMTMTASNIDDLDDLLSELTEASGEVLLRELSPDTVKQIVGAGAVWPDAEREEFINRLFLEVEAASSGRPNKALEVANIRELAPLLIALGAKPQAVVREVVKRLDDRLDVNEFFPLMPQAPPGGVPVQNSTGEEEKKPTKPGGRQVPTAGGGEKTLPLPNLAAGLVNPMMQEAGV